MKLTAGFVALGVMIGCGGNCFSQQKPDAKPDPAMREWTSVDGRKMLAGYQGVRGASVFLKLQNGKTVPIALFKLSAADNEFVKNNRFEYRKAWSAWPSDAQISIPSVAVRESEGKSGGFVYETAHFRYMTDVNLGQTLMKDLATVFELTYQLHSKSPFGILAKPENDLFEARLFGKIEDYQAAGGPLKTAGVYLPKDKVFLSPLDLMGVKSGSAGWRRVSRDQYDTSTIVHELTHMLTHQILDTLPIWLNEGYAEYIATIPINGNSFRVSGEKIRDGVRDLYIRDYEGMKSRGATKTARLSAADVREYLRGDKVPRLFHPEKILTMTDAEWVTAPQYGTFTPPGQLPRMGRLYRTSHLIVYYFIQIEGEKGVAKIRRFLDENRRQLARFEEYTESYRTYQKQIADFMKLPGVSKLPDGRIQYPSDLTFPKAPAAPFTDPNMLKMGGIDALLEGETAQVVGRRIETALREELDINLKFSD